MVLAIANRVKQTTATTGTGTLNLDATVPDGFQGFVAGIGGGNECHIVIIDGNAWEVSTSSRET